MSALSLPQSLQESLRLTKAEYTRLGSSGLWVSFPILGTLGLGSSQCSPWIKDEDESLEILKAAYDRGINTWDTANMYSNGQSEEVIGKAIRKFNIPREKLVIMTKCAYAVGEDPKVSGFVFGDSMRQSKDYVNQGGLSRNAIFTAVNKSLARLGSTYIDFLQIHRFDPTTPMEETMKALHDLVQAGKVRYIGASSMWATQFAQMQFVAEKNGWTKFVSMQNYYNLCYREEEREMIRFCKETGVGIMPWSPMFSGRLARPLARENSTSLRKIPFNTDLTAEDKAIITRVEELAATKSWRLSEVALAWHKAKGTIPIVGLNSVNRVNEACELSGKVLTEDDVKYLEEPYRSRAVAGHN